MTDKPTEGFGRGGRGAFLLAALKTQTRRPGQTSTSDESSNVETVEPPKPQGRGAFLQSLFPQGRGRVIPSEVGEPEKSEKQELPKFVGRGRGLALSSILGQAGRGIPKTDESPTSAAASSPPKTSPPEQVISPTVSDAPVSEFEDLTIGKYCGTSGTPLNLEVNYVRLKVPSGKGIHEYHVSFSPSVDSKNMKFRLISNPSVKEVIGNVKTFDGSKLYLPVKLPASSVFQVNLPTDNSLVTVTIKYIKMCAPRDCLHLFNILFRRVMNILKMTQILDIKLLKEMASSQTFCCIMAIMVFMGAFIVSPVSAGGHGGGGMLGGGGGHGKHGGGSNIVELLAAGIVAKMLSEHKHGHHGCHHG